MRYYVIILFSIMIIGCQIADQPELQNDNKTEAAISEMNPEELIKSLQGKWNVVSSKGKPNDGHIFVPPINNNPIEIKGNIMWLDGEFYGRISKRLVLRPDISPFAIDIEAESPKAKTWERIGIVKCIGDRIELCINFPGTPRPTHFGSANDGSEYVILKRVKGEK
jgi:uncharacterized protein (TIGR03067 family)